MLPLTMQVVAAVAYPSMYSCVRNSAKNSGTLYIARCARRIAAVISAMACDYLAAKVPFAKSVTRVSNRLIGACQSQVSGDDSDTGPKQLIGA